jgi:hypothetical protein
MPFRVNTAAEIVEQVGGTIEPTHYPTPRTKLMAVDSFPLQNSSERSP